MLFVRRPADSRAAGRFLRAGLLATLAFRTPAWNGESIAAGEPAITAKEDALPAKFVNYAAPEVGKEVEARLRLQWKRYALLLPPRFPPSGSDEPLFEVRLYGTLADYRAALAEHGLRLENSAAYLTDARLILLGFDGAQFDAALDAAQKQVAQRKAEIEKLARAFAAKQKEDNARFQREQTPEAVRKELQLRRRRDFQRDQAAAAAAQRQAEAANQAELDTAVRRILANGSHELFHAYVATRLYRAPSDRLPSWLNEGLAQTVEYGRWRNDRLLVDVAPPPELLRQLNPDASGAAAHLDLRTLLTADDAQFLAHGAAASGDARRAYLAAWSLTQYLASIGAFSQRSTLDAYAADGDADPVRRFERFVGRDLATVEADWRAYLGKWVK